MSTVLPDALPDELLPAAAVLLLLPLLLQPAAARATAARAAIAWIRLIIFLSLIRIDRLPRSTVPVLPGPPVRASPRCDSRRMNSLITSAAATAPAMASIPPDPEPSQRRLMG
jgi:hypothetical protein